METSTKYGFYLPSRDTDDIADINQISDNFRIIDDDVQEKLESGTNIKTINNQSLLGSGNIEIQGEADQTYSSTSPNAQSGIAVAEAVSGKMDRFGDVTAFGDINIDTGENVLHNIQILLDAPKLLLNTQDEENAELCGIATPDGTDPTQAANVEFVKKARDMRLLIDHTVTADESAANLPFMYTLDMNGYPFKLDAIHVFIEIPNAMSQTRNFTFYLNGSMTNQTVLGYISVGQGAIGTYWLDAEKIAPDYWRTLRTSISSNASNRQIYSTYMLEDIDTIHMIRVAALESGVRYRIWGRDAI